MAADEEDQKLCPSAPCTEGALLLGRVGPDGRVRFLPFHLPVNKEFVEAVGAGPKPETRFRFAAPCLNTSCVQWQNDQCGVAKLATSVLDDLPAEEADNLPKCAIRKDCRWFAQSSIDACKVCALVTTQRAEDQSEESA